MTRWSRMRPAEAERGFTLVETVVALTLVALMAVTVWAAFRVSVASWRRGTEATDSNQRHRTITDLVKKQMASIHGVLAPVDLQTGGAIYPIFSGSETSLQFVSLASLRFQDNPGLTMVSYDAVQDREGLVSLVEREEQYLGLDPARESIFDREDQQVIPIYENLSSFSFEYFDPGDREQSPRWLKEWSGKEEGRMPAAISMVMTSLDARGRPFSRHLVVPIAAKPYDPRLSFVNPFENRPQRFREDDERSVR